MPLSAQEQYLLELINRGRLDPGAEAARYGADLNAGLAPGTISTAAKQVLAPNALLERAAIGHSQWMLATDVFSHTGANGSTLGSRVNATGYQWNLLGENIAVWGTSGTLNPTSAIDAHHKGLFLSAGHRTNLMNAKLNEVGLAQEMGRFAFSGGSEMNASMLTENFGAKNGAKFLTGVAYTDTNKDGFYSVGEGKAATQFKVGAIAASTEAAGGYALSVAAPGEVLVSGLAGSVNFTVTVDFSIGNVKLDIVNGTTFQSSAHVKLGTGINNVDLLGIGQLNVVGSAASNNIKGNAGVNLIWGNSGNDLIEAGNGNDLMDGGIGYDRLFGNSGNDVLSGDEHNDYLTGGTGNDTLHGGAGADLFVFGNLDGADQLLDFTLAHGDVLMLNDDLWTGTMTSTQVVNRFATVTSAGVVFNFGDGDTMTLTGVTSTAGLASIIYFW